MRDSHPPGARNTCTIRTTRPCRTITTMAPTLDDCPTCPGLSRDRGTGGQAPLVGSRTGIRQCLQGKVPNHDDITLASIPGGISRPFTIGEFTAIGFRSSCGARRRGVGVGLKNLIGPERRLGPPPLSLWIFLHFRYLLCSFCACRSFVMGANYALV